MVVDDGDIGMCDDCGVDPPRLLRQVVSEVVAGEPKRLAIYLCERCTVARLSARSVDPHQEGE